MARQKILHFEGVLMTVAEIMTTEVRTASMDDTLGGIREVFERHHFHHIPIVEDNELVGIISDRDVLKNLSPRVDSTWANNHDTNTLKRKTHQIMTRKVITISPDNTIEEAAATMLEKKFNCLPVLEQSGAILGIVTKTDLLRSLCGKDSAVSC
jgi:acetoin utilization protein AcuB